MFRFSCFLKCGQGSTDDELSPTSVSSLLGIKIVSVAAGLWHTVCISADGDVYAFGGNQFGQLGTGGDQAEVNTVFPFLDSYIQLTPPLLALHKLFKSVFQNQTLPRLLEDPSLENSHVKVASCGARHSAIITGMMVRTFQNLHRLFCARQLTICFFCLKRMGKYSAGDGTSMARCHSVTRKTKTLSSLFLKQLGLGDVIDRSTPSQVTIEGCRPKNIVCGWWHTLLLAESAS
ncbi:hypothetical protein Gorai_004311 [Gossypium raimondii]|uniref:Uncharacterized protein n=1 Tax=Gossypium raimondii TaxID=29730 RepID=A0A7J8QHU6_GOSRA|nr:hypothetical protein [Gossypium raimondii]